VRERLRWWFREPRTAGAGDRQVSVEDIPITNTVRADRVYIIVIDPCRRLMLYVLAIIGFISAGCIAGLPSTTCYALADAYTTTLQFISGFIMIPISLYILLVGIDFIIKKEKEKAYKLFYSKWTTVILLLMSCIFIFILMSPFYISEKGIKNVRLAINHCFAYATEHEQNLHDKIPLYRKLFTNTPTLD
jgi:hypothetical protein